MSSTSQTPPPPPGWYPDPEGPPGQLRYWDGTAWTDHRHQQSAAGAGTAPQAGGRELADFGTRLVAFVVDGAVVGVGLGLVAVAFVALIAVAGRSDATAVTVTLVVVMVLTLLMLGVGYAVVLEGGPRGQTIGKYVMGLRVVRPDGVSPIGYGAALGRNLVKGLLSGSLFYLGYLWMLWDDERRTWHDMAATTRVVRDPGPKPAFGDFLRSALRRA